MSAGHGVSSEAAQHYIDGEWRPGNPPIMGPMTHASWMASVVFDGARAFSGATPDLDLHCRRLVDSALAFGMGSPLSAEQILEIARDGVARYPKSSELYIRPMYWAENGSGRFFVMPDPESTRFCLSIFPVPMPTPGPLSVCLSSYQRPLAKMAPTNAKAACLYPNSGLALKEAAETGFDNAVILDGLGNVAELATANIWLGKDGEAHTPVANGTFLSGITRARVATLLRKAGITVHERTITWQEVHDADELFTTGNLGKVLPITKVAERDLQPGPVYRKAREIYWDWALG